MVHGKMDLKLEPEAEEAQREPGPPREEEKTPARQRTGDSTTGSRTPKSTTTKRRPSAEKSKTETPSRRRSVSDEEKKAEGAASAGAPAEKKLTEKRWRIFGPAAFSEVLLRAAVEYLTFHGNPVQQRCSAYSKGIWLLTHLHSVFRQAADSLPAEPAEDETRFVRPLHGLLWGPDGPELFSKHPRVGPKVATLEPHISDDDLSEDEDLSEDFVPEPEPETQRVATGRTPPVAASRSQRPSNASTGPAKHINPQAAAAAATMKLVEEKQALERQLEEKRRRYATKIHNATARRKVAWTGEWS